MKNTYEGRNLKEGFEIKINFSSSVHGEGTIINGHPSAVENKFGAKKKYRCPLQGTSSSLTTTDRDRDRQAIAIAPPSTRVSPSFGSHRSSPVWRHFRCEVRTTEY